MIYRRWGRGSGGVNQRYSSIDIHSSNWFHEEGPLTLIFPSQTYDVTHLWVNVKIERRDKLCWKSSTMINFKKSMLKKCWPNNLFFNGILNNLKMSKHIAINHFWYDSKIIFKGVLRTYSQGIKRGKKRRAVAKQCSLSY